uniref:NADH-ubiquinone oxidoreductase chain 3 n=1 Tax=Cephalodiscus hodgsoni TaxID=560606 RepID=A0A481P7S4_9BILA|nr:NADH dehydrogenase subunit 3 [Cephalodiscus hodgsoni]
MLWESYFFYLLGVGVGLVLLISWGLFFIMKVYVWFWWRGHLDKFLPYECGFDPLLSARIPFSFRFFFIAVLFLFFDVEFCFLVVGFPLFLDTVLGLLVVLMVLWFFFWALYYEWAYGGLEWAEKG